MKPKNDTISRSGAIKAIEKKAKQIKNEDTLNGLAGAVAILFELPPVTQESGKPIINVLEQIRAEIEKVFCMSVVTNELRTPMEVKTEILQIIDKYKAESEEQK